MSHELDVHDLPEGVKLVYIKEQRVFDGLPFPLILSPADALKEKDAQFWNDWVKKNLKVIEGLLMYGAILFRGFPFDTPKDFDEFANAYDYMPFRNVYSLGVRSNVVGNVFTANELPPGGIIPLHHEMAHVKDYPLIMFFYCDLPANEGGETPIALSNVIYRKMAEREPDFVNRLEKEGVRYFRIVPDGGDLSTSYGPGWQSTFYASNREQAESKAKGFGYDFEWLDDGSMKTISDILPAIRVDKRTGKTIWFNSVFTYALILQKFHISDKVGVIFPNGDTISDETLETMNQVMEEVKVSYKWQHKDVVMIDNRTVQHSRSDFFVPPRRIMVSPFIDHQGPI